MKLQDLKIGTQLRIALGAILLLVAILGTASWFQAHSLWQGTKDLYEHPFIVHRAIGILKADFLEIRRGMTDMMRADSERERQAIIEEIDAHEADAARQLETLYKSYLGPRRDIDNVQDAFVQWRTIRVETVRLLQTGKLAEATDRTKSSGIGGRHLKELVDATQIISDFASKKGDKFYTDAQAKKETMAVSLAILVGAILLLAIAIVYLLSQAIKRPLRELISVAEQYGQGNLYARSRYISTNEFGALSDSFNSLAATIQIELRSKENTARIADAMLGNEELMAFCQTLLPELIARTESQSGAIYFLQEEKKLFEPYYAIGLTRDKMRSFSAEAKEGEFGAALTQKTITRTGAIPDDTLFDFATAAGSFKPKEIITIPVMQFQKVIAVISLASLAAYSEAALTIINTSWKSLNIGVIGMLAFEAIREYSRKLDEQAKELQIRAEELRENNQELQAQSEELEAQTEDLRKQSEELQGQNVELEQQRLAVEEASRLKSQFLSNMSHELRTPLNSVLALSQVLKMQGRTKLSPEELNYLEIIERNGRNLLMLINDILDLAKIEAGRMDLHPQPFSIRQSIKNIVESIAPLAEGKGIEILQDIPADLPLLVSDEIRLSQIMQNLIANAVKFTDAGRVTILARSDSESVSIRVADTGIGIAATDLPHIFDEFRQVDGTPARRHEGTGLGLAIARKAARMLGGDIAVTSAPGKGSTFTLTLPVAWQGTAPAYEPIVIRQPSGVRSERKTILVVDDEPDMAALISRYLLQEGYNTITATSGAEALKLARREHPFAITLDIIMPDMDGWEVLQDLKNNSETKDIPVIIISFSEDRETGFALGAVGYITKPVSKLLLIAEIQKLGRPEPRSVMIVDDNDLDRQEIRQIIAEEGFTVIEAEDGLACLELMKNQVPDVLVLDLMMPEPDGFTVLERIRGNPATRDLPVIIVTAKDLTEADRNKLSGKVSSVLEKSAVKSATLLAEIKRILIDLEGLPPQPGLENRAAPPRILYVEDNEAAIIQVKAVLAAAGYVVDLARGGQEAVDYIAHTIPAGIILDLMMPAIDGFAVLEKIRGTKATARIPVLILTAKDLTSEDLRRLSANNVQQLVQKGDIDRNSLLAKVRSMLGLYSLPQARLYVNASGKGTGLSASPGAPQATAKAAGPPVILVVEDNPDNLITIKAVLQDRYRIIAAADGEEGLRMAAEARPDLILLDMALPKMDGYKVVRRLKDNGELKQIPVIAITARVMKGDRENILAAGCDDYIAKPIDPAEFLKKIGEWMG